MLLSKRVVIDEPTLLSIRPSEYQLSDFYTDPDSAMRPRTQYSLHFMAPKTSSKWITRLVDFYLRDATDGATAITAWTKERCICMHVTSSLGNKLCDCPPGLETKVQYALWNVNCETFFWRSRCTTCNKERKWQTRNEMDNELVKFACNMIELEPL